MHADTSIHSGLLTASQSLITAQSRKILLVEDTAAHAALTRRALDKKIWTLTHVTRGQEAIEVFSENPDYIILLDIRLPDFDGITLISHFKSIHPQAPVIIVTSLEDVRESVQAMQSGAWDYVIKNDPETFSANLLSAIDGAWKRRIEQAEQKLAEECRVAELVKREKELAIEETIKKICTEINNPLSGLLTYGSILQSEAMDAHTSEIMEKLVDSAKNVAKAVSKLENLAIEMNRR